MVSSTMARHRSRADALTGAADSPPAAGPDRYLRGGADFYKVVEAAATEDADLELDGLEHRDVLTTQVLSAITRQLPAPPTPP